MIAASAALTEVREGLGRSLQSHERVRELAKNPANIERGTYDASEEGPSPGDLVRDEALRTIERHVGHMASDAADSLDELVRHKDPAGIGARYLSAVGDPLYNSAFGHLVAEPVTGQLRMSRAELERRLLGQTASL